MQRQIGDSIENYVNKKKIKKPEPKILPPSTPKPPVNNVPNTQPNVQSQDELMNILQSRKAEVPNTPQTNYADTMKSYVNNMYNNQKSAQLAQLKAEREKAIGGLNQQKNELKPQYQGMRNQADVGYNQNVQRLREAMANAGLTSSGENVSAQTSLMGARQGALNGLNLQQQEETNDINRRIGDLNNPNDVLALTSAIDAQRNQALLGAYQNAIGRQDQLTQQDFTNNMVLDKFNYGMQQDQINNAYRQQQLEINARQFAQQMGYNYDRLNQSDRQFYDNLAIRQAEQEQQQAQDQANRIVQQDLNQQQSQQQQEYNNALSSAYGTLQQQLANNTAQEWLQANAQGLIQTLGIDEYRKMVEQAQGF